MKMNIDLENRILNRLKMRDLAVFGIGSASEMESGPEGYQPKDFLPGTESIICFATPVPASTFHSNSYPLEITWRSQNLLYRHLDSIALELCALLEEYDESAVPIYGCMPLGVNDNGTIVGIFNQLQMAESIGIGIIGKNGLLLHSRYGARLMLGGLLTTATLQPVRYPEDSEAGCPPNCRICADICPVSAIIPEKKKVRSMRCISYTSRTPLMSRLKFAFLRLRNKQAAARYMSITSFDEHTFHICSKCVSLCPYGTQ